MNGVAQQLSVWDFRWLSLASHLATWSPDPDHKAGGVVVRGDQSVAAIGFSGIPEPICTTEANGDETARRFLRLTAEQATLLRAGTSAIGARLYVSNLIPTEHLASLIAASGVMRVMGVSPYAPEMWEKASQNYRTILQQAGVGLQVVFPTQN